MLTFLPLLSLLSNVVMVVLQSAGVATPGISALVTSLESSVLPLIANLTAGNSKMSDVLAALGALSGVISTLQGSGVSPELMDQLNLLDGSVKAALAAYVQSGKGIDLKALAPIAPVA